MIPNSDIIDDFTLETDVSETYYLDMEKNRIIGRTDGIEAVKQAIYLLLSTERFQYPVYEGYGVELAELIGKEKPYVIPEIERRITEALLTDDRIISASNFEFDFNRGKYHVTFDVNTIFGGVEIESEVTA